MWNGQCSYYLLLGAAVMKYFHPGKLMDPEAPKSAPPAPKLICALGAKKRPTRRCGLSPQRPTLRDL